MKPWDNIILNDDEKEAAIIEGKKKKYFHEKNKGYWDAQQLEGELRPRTYGKEVPRKSNMGNNH